MSTPELYFIALFSWWAIYIYRVDAIILYPAIIGAAILILQLIAPNKFLGYLASVVLGLCSLYLIFALVSDVKNAPTFESRTLKFILEGGFLILANLTIAISMFRKYFKANDTETINAVGQKET
jgi:hypothetical protein